MVGATMVGKICIVFASAFFGTLAGNLLGNFIRYFVGLVWDQWKNEEYK